MARSASHEDERHSGEAASLDQDDWLRIGELLAGPSEQTLADTCASARLKSLLDQLRAWTGTQIVSADRVADWLLDVWAYAREVDPAVALPAESMLCSLVERDVVCPHEIDVTCDEIELALDPIGCGRP